MHVLVTGGAGYIGSHAVLALRAAGHAVTVFDDLSTGRREALGDDVPLVRASVTDGAALAAVFAASRFDAVMHFAARLVVPESVTLPLPYYATNVGGTVALLQACQQAGVGLFVFSSSAAVYGVPERMPIVEDAPLAPINPYGATKAMSERVLADFAATGALRYAALRYFNVAGADPQGRTGQAGPGATHLIKVACEVAVGKRAHLAIYGTDYPTPDGTCVRDYIHVSDLADAHVAALEHLAGGGDSVALNCGYGRGYSVRQVVDAMAAVLGTPLPAEHAPRRPGDPPALVADAARARATLGWAPRYDDLDFILRTALAWERKLAGSAVR
jgi:UDP-glucose 4-epimerase